MKFGIATTVAIPYVRAVERIKEELTKEGFGVITSIDMRETFQKKLGVEFKQYCILGACNPGFALQALQADETIGLLLPCNIIVAEQGSETMVAAFDPLAISALVDRPEVEEIAREVKIRLERALRALSPARAAEGLRQVP